jgi:enterochelin esterase-like enzyme
VYAFKSSLLVALVIVLAASVAEAQQRGREVSWVNPDIPEMKGLVHKVLASKSLGHDVGYVVWTPPDFDASGTTRYPVVYFLHGAGGSEKSDSAGFSGRVAAAIRAKKMPPVICVYPNGGMSGYRGDVESMIVDELIPLIDKDYPTKAAAAGRVLCGFSMGGAGAVNLSIRHPDLFCGAGSWGGALAFRGRAEESPLLPLAKQNADQLKKGKFALLTINGDQDRPDGFQPLESIFKEAGLEHKVVVLQETGHNLGKYYELSGDTLLAFLARQLKGAN